MVDVCGLDIHCYLESLIFIKNKSLWQHYTIMIVFNYLISVNIMEQLIFFMSYKIIEQFNNYKKYNLKIQI